MEWEQRHLPLQTEALKLDGDVKGLCDVSGVGNPSSLSIQQVLHLPVPGLAFQSARRCGCRLFLEAGGAFASWVWALLPANDNSGTSQQEAPLPCGALSWLGKFSLREGGQGRVEHGGT